LAVARFPAARAHSRAFAALVAGLAALCGSTAARADAWTAPFDVVSLHADVQSIGSGLRFYPAAQVASSPAVTVFAWTDLDGGSYRVQARTRSNDTGEMSPVIDLAGTQPLNRLSAVAAGPAGHAVLIWSHGGLGTPTQAQTLFGGRLGPVVNLSGSGLLQRLGPQDVKIDAAGDAVIASLTYDKQVQLQTLSATSALGPLVTIPRPDAGYGPIAMAVAPSGRAVVAWDNSRREDRRMLARTASAAGRIGPVVTLWQGQHPRRAQSPVAGVSDAGDAVITWRIESRYRNVRRRVESRTVGVDGTLGPVLDLSSSGREGAQDVLVAPGGRGVISWTQPRSGERGARLTTHARLLSPGGGRGAKLAIAGVPPNPALSISDSGRVTFAWVDAGGVVLARALSAAGALGPIRRLSAPGERATVAPDEPGVTISPGERPAVAWIRGSTVRAAVGP
jgi:hypothetical protein